MIEGKEHLNEEYDSQYLIKFCDDNFPRFDLEFMGKSALPYLYFKQRNEILKSLPFKREHFDSFDILQESIKKLNLNANALFEFIAFLYNQIEFTINTAKDIQELKQCILKKKIRDELKSIAKIDIEKPIKTDITIEITDFYNYNIEDYSNFENKKSIEQMYIFNTTYTNRHKQYMMVKNLEMGLPTVIRRNGVQYTNKERDFYLRIIYLCKYLYGNPENVCFTKYNSATFNKLMRDFEPLDCSLLESDFSLENYFK